MLTSVVEKEWAEVRRKGRGKVEDWSWTVTFLENGAKIDQHYINNETDAMMVSALFEAGAFALGVYGEVYFDSAFE